MPASTPSHRSLSVDLPAAQRGYDILIEPYVLDRAGEELVSRFGQRRVIIITDDNVAPLYAKRLEKTLLQSGHDVLGSIVVSAGEHSKNFETLNFVLEAILAKGADRKTLLIALGGGVVGDLVGCAAALAMRGMRLVQIPTTLLSQVDSSVGGKNGINSTQGKNTIGTFYQPCLVLMDPHVLDTLPKRELLAGYAEVVKYGLIRSESFFEWCEQNAQKMLAGDVEARLYALRFSCTMKAEIVSEDEREQGIRALLNLGHTFGHALEASAGFNSGLLLHGEGVSIGTLLAYRMAAKRGLCAAEDVARIEKHFKNVGLPTVPPVLPPHQTVKNSYDCNRLVECMRQDKKAEKGEITLVLPTSIGAAQVFHSVEVQEVRDIWGTLL